MKKETILERFIKYVKVNTQADPESKSVPSSEGQLKLARIVKEDFEKAGIDNIKLSEDGFLFGTIPSNLPKNHPSFNKVPTLGFVAHLDVAPDCSGENIKPQVIKNYDGEDIKLPNNPEVVLKPEEMPALKECRGHTIITTDGTTLLGADDKAGIAAIVELAHYLKRNPERLHGDIRLAIIPDEEIGVGACRLSIKEFGAEFAYTIDGSGWGEIDVESFNGYGGKIVVTGNATFPGYGKGVYLNAAKILAEFVAAMPEELWPENSEAREDACWVDSFKGEVDQAETVVFLRSFDLAGIDKQEKILEGIKRKLLKKYPRAKINVSIKEVYKNYKSELDKDKRVVAYAEEAIKRTGLKPTHQYVRGGNDSSHLCYAGLLSTNLSAGYQNMHSLKEWASLEAMQKATEVMANICEVWIEKG